MKFNWPWKKELVKESIIIIPKYSSELRITYIDNMRDSWSITGSDPINKDCWKEFLDWFGMTSKLDKDARDASYYTMNHNGGFVIIFYKNIYSIEVRVRDESSSGLTIE